MKYLDIPALAGINAQLERIYVGDCVIKGRIEAYSCKTVGSDKKLYRSLDNELSKSPHKSPATYLTTPPKHNNNAHPSDNNTNLSTTPTNSLNTSNEHQPHGAELAVSPFGPLTQPSSRKTMIYLIATLNATYLDYDFSDVSADQFRKEPNRHMVINSINTTLSSVITNYNTELRDNIWHTIDMEVDTPRCDIYSYIPDLTSDPFSEEGTTWSFNYFFYNRALKRIIYFTCSAISKSNRVQSRLAAAAGRDPSEGMWELEEDSKDGM